MSLLLACRDTGGLSWNQEASARFRERHSPVEGVLQMFKSQGIVQDDSVDVFLSCSSSLSQWTSGSWVEWKRSGCDQGGGGDSEKSRGSELHLDVLVLS